MAFSFSVATVVSPRVSVGIELGLLLRHLTAFLTSLDHVDSRKV